MGSSEDCADTCNGKRRDVASFIRWMDKHEQVNGHASSRFWKISQPLLHCDSFSSLSESDSFSSLSESYWNQASLQAIGCLNWNMLLSSFRMIYRNNKFPQSTCTGALVIRKKDDRTNLRPSWRGARVRQPPEIVLLSGRGLKCWKVPIIYTWLGSLSLSLMVIQNSPP